MRKNTLSKNMSGFRDYFNCQIGLSGEPENSGAKDDSRLSVDRVLLQF